MRVRRLFCLSVQFVVMVVGLGLSGGIAVAETQVAQADSTGFRDAVRTPPIEMGWRPISGTSSPAGEVPSSDFWYVRANTIARSGNIINFDVYANREYVRYSANCRSRLMSRILQGYINRNGEVIANRLQEEFFPADNSLQRRLVLDYACSQNQ